MRITAGEFVIGRSHILSRPMTKSSEYMVRVGVGIDVGIMRITDLMA
jgi:hypothetical protein